MLQLTGNWKCTWRHEKSQHPMATSSKGCGLAFVAHYKQAQANTSAAYLCCKSHQPQCGSLAPRQSSQVLNRLQLYSLMRIIWKRRPQIGYSLTSFSLGSIGCVHWTQNLFCTVRACTFDLRIDSSTMCSASTRRNLFAMHKPVL